MKFIFRRQRFQATKALPAGAFYCLAGKVHFLLAASIAK
ncbi:hypothetical protein SPONN_1444 [uncultured Candidatus Thioglobus sp.]|nr:hypothetical protein SPONN_1444 [uncultured Candidatus Thioglobus sp.]